MFQGTLRDNLVMARPDAPRRRGPTAALAAVEAHWVVELPDGLDTEVGSGGLALSPAQAQQLALARLVLADPHTLVLDEATSLLDPRAARHLERIAGGRARGPYGRRDRAPAAHRARRRPGRGGRGRPDHRARRPRRARRRGRLLRRAVGVLARRARRRGRSARSRAEQRAAAGCRPRRAGAPRTRGSPRSGRRTGRARRPRPARAAPSAAVGRAPPARGRARRGPAPAGGSSPPASRANSRSVNVRSRASGVPARIASRCRSSMVSTRSAATTIAGSAAGPRWPSYATPRAVERGGRSGRDRAPLVAVHAGALHGDAPPRPARLAQRAAGPSPRPSASGRCCGADDDDPEGVP